MIVGVAFVTMAVGVTARTAFSLLMPPLLDEFGWGRGLAAGAFSFGFLISAALSPVVGRVMDARGPRVVILKGVLLTTAGLLLAPSIERPWHLYATLGVLVSAGANMMTYTAHSHGWRASCWAMGILTILTAGPLNLLIRKRPEDIGLLPDGASQMAPGNEGPASHIVDSAWAAIEWTLGRAVRTSRFWWIAVGYFCALVAWYAVQVHQTKYLIEIGFGPLVAAWSLGAVSVAGIPGQISLGALSDRIGREWIWTAGCAGFAICYAALIALDYSPSVGLLYLMVISQGFFGYALTSVMGPLLLRFSKGRTTVLSSG